MPSETPFIDSATGDLDRAQIVSEAVPIGKLVGLFVGLSLVPFGLVYFVFGGSTIGAMVMVVGQFVLVVGAGIVLLYVVARGQQLSGTRTT